MTRACLLLLVVACTRVSPPPPPVDAAPPPDAMPAPKEGEELARWYLDCVRRQWAEPGCLAADVLSESDLAPPIQGATAYLASVADGQRRFSDFRFLPQLVLVNGRRIVAVALGTGRRDQDGKPTAQFWGEVLDVDGENRLRKEWAYGDANTLRWQLGASDRPARPASTKGVSVPLVVVEQGSAEEAENLERARLRVEAWNAHDLAALAAGLAGKVVFRDATAPHDFDRTAHLAAEKAWWKAREDDRWTTSSTLAARDHVAVIGQVGPVALLEILRFERGKIVHAWRFYKSP